MAPRTRPKSELERRRVSPKDEHARVRVGIEASERGEGLELTAEEATHYYASGVLPERVTKWAASRG